MPGIRHISRSPRSSASSGVRALTLILALGGLLAPGASGSVSRIDGAAPVGELVVGKATELSVRGVADPAETSEALIVHVQTNPPGVPCAATPAQNAPHATADTYGLATYGAMVDHRIEFTPEAPGPALLCTYLRRAEDESTVFPSAQTPVQVRRPHVALELQAGDVPSGGTLLALARASAETDHRLRIEANRRGRACGSSEYSNDGDVVLMMHERVDGEPLEIGVEAELPDGLWRLCGYLVAPLAVVPSITAQSEPFRVGAAPECRLGPAPRRVTSRLRISCTGPAAMLTLRVRIGRSSRTIAVPTSQGRALVPGRRLGLRPGRLARVEILVDGQTVATGRVRLPRRA